MSNRMSYLKAFRSKASFYFISEFNQLGFTPTCTGYATIELIKRETYYKETDCTVPEITSTRQ